MNVELEQEGGFANVRLRWNIDSDDLELPERNELDEKVRASSIITNPPASPSNALPDTQKFTYRIWTDSGKTHSASFSQTEETDELADLREFIMNRAEPVPVDAGEDQPGR